MFYKEKRSQRKLTKKVYGVGVNDSWYKVYIKDEYGASHRCPIYRKWTAMLERCYSEKYHKKEPTYKSCFVCDEWKRFSNFARWMEGQDWIGKHLDKDILYPGNKEYSPEKCVFVDQSINNLLTNVDINNIFYNKTKKRFIATISKFNKRIHIGNFLTMDEALKAYKKEKSNYIKNIMSTVKDKFLIDGFKRHIEALS